VKTVVWFALLGLILLLAQGAASWFPETLRPDPLLVFALAMGLRGGSVSSLLLACAAGAALDVWSGSPVGLFALLRSSACVATRAFDGALYLRAGLPWTLFVAAYSVVDALLMVLCLQWFVGDATLAWGPFFLRLPGAALATGLIAAPVLWAYRRIDADAVRETGWGFIASGTRARP
jgi:cell shape-determining protein MreD